MFIVFGINTKDEIIREWHMECPDCDEYSKFRLYARYTYFSLFFIPIIKWGHEFWVVNSCCNNVYSIDKELGKECMWDEDQVIRARDLRLIKKNTKYRCKWCNSKLEKLSRYCPECGREL